MLVDKYDLGKWSQVSRSPSESVLMHYCIRQITQAKVKCNNMFNALLILLILFSYEFEQWNPSCTV